MTSTQYYTATSIDGFIADEHNSLDWLFRCAPSDDKENRFSTFFAGIGAMAMGATTYEWVLAHEDMLSAPDKWRGYYGNTPCWVFSHRDLPPIPGANLVFVQGEVTEVHAAMVTAANGKNVWLVGGGDLVGQFADQGLLDEILLGVAPVMLGAGAPLLPRHLDTGLRLTGAEHDGDFAFLTYQVTAGKPSAG